ncbi:MAG: YlqD family protein [Candidatus Margulisbacteria bacterium]|nr:YlqD family protein [Candidatus Margulisiibacteriota bacterium]
MPVRLKRTVTIKVIVTEEFKKYLISELERAVKNLDSQLDQMEGQGKKLIDTLKKQGEKTKKQVSAISQQINLDRQQEKLAKSDLEKKIKDAQLLPLNSEFIQGTVDGFVDVDKGDNLYKKLGALEIIIKDGTIQEIRGND